MMMPMMGGGMFFWFIIPVLLLMGIAVFLMLQQSNSVDSTSEKRKRISKSAQKIADERLATGDISAEEHQEIRKHIENSA